MSEVRAVQKTEMPEINAQAAIVVTQHEGRILLEKNARMKLPPAFLTKITASIIALEKCNPTDKVTVSENVVKQVSGWKSAAAINLEAGEQISVLDLVYSMMLVSANDSLFALAEFICGGIDKFAVMMEEKAKEIPVMPEELTMPMLPSYPGYEKTICKVPIGLDTDTLQVYYLPMEQAPAFILGNAKTGKTNVIKNMLTLLSDEKVYVFDNKSHELAAYQSKENVVYAGDKSAVAASLNQIKEEVFARKEEYEEAKLDDVSMSMETFVKTLPPIYVMVDMLQELYENVEEDNSRIDILEEAVRYGIYVLVTSEFKVKKMTRSKFIEMLLASREVLILGNIKDQLLFSYTGVREENRKVEFGYYHNAGVNRKVKLIFHREMK